jgi:hypothetical protein
MTTITQFSRSTYEPPDDVQLKLLFDLVTIALPDLRQAVTPAEFSRAMFVVAGFGRIAAPDSRQYFSFWHTRANERLAASGLPEIARRR